MPNTKKNKKVLIVFFLLIAILTSVGLSALSKKKSASMEYNHAFIIGINNYDYWPKLGSPVKDAETVAKILLDKYDFKKENIVLLTDKTAKQPTEEVILDYLDEYIGKLTEKDNLLIFFSGHSTEDDEGETYWIPKDGRKRLRYWLSHTQLSDAYFSAKDFKAKSLLILTDSHVNSKLIKPTPITLSPYDLRYPEKIKEKASRKSREIIAFGDQHWPGSPETKGNGLFAHYLVKAMEDNFLPIIDFENLMFDENIIFPISKIAGTKLQRGRLESASEAGGQFIIRKLTPARIVDVIDAFANPTKAYPGDTITVEALTSSPSGEVYIEFGEQKRLMRGEERKWKYRLKAEKGGANSFKVTAINEDNLPGKPQTGQFSVMKKSAPISNVVTAQIIPKKGKEGEEFSFRALTDKPANKVTIRIKGKRFEMEGAGTRWYLNKIVKEVGNIDFSIIASNEDGVKGLSKGSKFQVEATPVNVVEVIPTPRTGFAGDEFTITVRTDRPATNVALQLDGTEYTMQGSGKMWRYTKIMPDIGSKKFTVVARNVGGKDGRAKSSEILTKKRPLAVPDVAAVDVSILSPGKGYSGDSYEFKVKTNKPTDAAYVEIEGRKIALEGSGTNWNITTKVDKVGTSNFIVIAQNKDGVQGVSKTGKILTKKRPLPIPDVTLVAVNPKKAYQGEMFSIDVKTSKASDKVFVEIDGKKIAMKGADTNWNYQTQIDQVGTKKIKVIALNKDGKQGKTKDGSILIAKRPAKAVDVIAAAITPAKGLQGDNFTINAKTSSDAKSVELVVRDKRYKMTGSGTQWSLQKKIEDVGTLSYSVVAKNQDGVEGRSKIGSVVITAQLVNVVEVSAPKTGYAGDDFIITAKTNLPATGVSLKMDGIVYAMEGSGKTWRLKKKIPAIGKKQFSIIAKNIEGKDGLFKSGEILTEKRPIAIPDVASISVSPETGFEGDSFEITAQTTLPANTVSLKMDGKVFNMEGSGTKWRLQRTIPDIGKKQFTIVAKNVEGMDGRAKSASILTKKKALAPPDIAFVDVNVVSPGKGYVGDSFEIKAKTTTPSATAFIEIDGKQHPMKGSDTEWSYIAKIDKVGINKYSVIAKNKAGAQGKVKVGEIITAEQPEELVNVVLAKVTPEKATAGKVFTFQANTDRSAKGVTLVLGDRRYNMRGSDTNWSFRTKLTKIGEQQFSMIPINEKDKEGGIRRAIVTVEKIRQQYRLNKDGTVTDILTGQSKARFVDNGDGTITDHFSGLMWLKQPKQVALPYASAVEFCRNLKIKDYTGWRLPTISELNRIADKKQQNPSLPQNHPFSGVVTHVGYWSKSKHKFGPQYVYQMNLWFGKAAHLKKTDSGIVWPVRYEKTPEG